MSEHQYVAFRAVDGPVDEKNLEYMRQQSSRAEVTPWSFDNEYHFGDFRGNAAEMLRRGYDLHLHYANFGIRKLMIRLPHGLPNIESTDPYFADESLEFVEDKKGPGGILSISPFHEPGDHEDLFDVGDLLDQLVPLRAEILNGDLRPFYLAHLAMACDGNHDPNETIEAPVPAGLDSLSNAQRALAELYGIEGSLIAAAAQQSSALSERSDPRNAYAAWLQCQPEAIKNAWLVQWLGDPHSTLRTEILAEFRKSNRTPSWPTTCPDRTIAALQAAANEIHEVTKKKVAETAVRDRAKRLANLAADPTKAFRETEQLVKQRSSKSYSEIATLLADLREALADSNQSALAEQQARKLKSENPTLNKLTGELRRNGFLKK